MSNPYSGPMSPAPQLAPFARTVTLHQPRATVHVYDAGPKDRPAIVLIHGLQDEADSWRHVLPVLAQSHRVVALDLPGFGRSDKSKRSYGVPLYSSVVLAVMDALHIPYATLVGNSMGAMIAEMIALTQPSRVLRLVLVDGTLRLRHMPPTPMSSPLGWLLAPGRDRRYFEILRQSPQAAFDTLQLYYADVNSLPKTDGEFLFQRVNERVWDEDQRLAALSIQRSFPAFFIARVPELVRRIPALAVPTQVIWGAQDRIMPIENGQERAALQPNASFIEVANAGHLPHQEKPEAWLRALALPTLP